MKAAISFPIYLMGINNHPYGDVMSLMKELAQRFELLFNNTLTITGAKVVDNKLISVNNFVFDGPKIEFRLNFKIVCETAEQLTKFREIFKQNFKCQVKDFESYLASNLTWEVTDNNISIIGVSNWMCTNPKG